MIRYVYYGYGKKDKVSWGLLQDDDETVMEGTGDPWRGFVQDKNTTDLSDVRLFRPLAPGQIIEMDGATMLIKAPARTYGPNDKISLPRRVRQMIAFGKLGIIMGKKASQLTAAQAPDCILGYTGVLEFNASNLHKSEVGCVFGPGIATELNPSGLNIQIWVNDLLRANLKIQLDVAQIVSQASQQRVLAPGDVVLSVPLPILKDDFQTGLLYPGDVVQLKIEKIGQLNVLCSQSK